MFALNILQALFLITLVFATSAPPALAQQKSLAEATRDWLDSGHGDYRSSSYTHWNKDGEIPTTCAACHSETGFLDWLGADGSAAGTVDHPATINTAIGCVSCHTAEAHALDSVTFPSGVTVSGLETSATCTACHQGRTSTDTVKAATAGLDPDTVSEKLSLISIHYGVAAATAYGNDVRGGFEYDGRGYAGRFAHVPSANTCVSCHDPHTTQVATDGCLACHQGVAEITGIRTRHKDFDGDGDRKNGIRSEIAGLHALLYAAIQTYAQDVVGVPIAVEDHTYPYFFHDTNGDGVISANEAVFPNRYASWTPRMVRAAYNYQMIAKDLGAWAHNPVYALQLLHDSIKDLSEKIDFATPTLARP